MNTTLPHFARAALVIAATGILSLLSGCREGGYSMSPPAPKPPTPAAQPPAPDATPANPAPASPAQENPPVNPAVKTQTALFGAGCFWGVEHIFRKQVPGVIDAVSGYSGGHLSKPTYQQVCEGDTGHVEVVQVTFDPAKVSYEQLVDIFFRLHDPTQVNRQGPDIGEQYRSVIYFASPEQQKTAETVKARRQAKHDKPIATTIEPAKTFYPAEDYHQRYYERTGKVPYCHFLRPE